jgi:SAM-dependent methyltransferase
LARDTTRGLTAHGTIAGDDLGRPAKARGIELVLSAALGVPALRGRSLLDIGCGNGQIATHFAVANRVAGVDVVDRRHPDARAFPFALASDERLPFGDASFDVVLSNHVVPYLPDQPRHFQEMARVLRPGGAAYVATHNRWFPLEPHFRIPLLPWLPARLASAGMRKAGLYQGSVRFVSRSDVRRMARAAALIPVELTHVLLKARLPLLPAKVAQALQPVCPTVIFVLTKPQSDAP